MTNHRESYHIPGVNPGYSCETRAVSAQRDLFLTQEREHRTINQQGETRLGVEHDEP